MNMLQVKVYERLKKKAEERGHEMGHVFHDGMFGDLHQFCKKCHAAIAINADGDVTTDLASEANCAS